MTDVIIVGGGISGLVAAWELKRIGHPVLVLERQARAGGSAISERIGGFLMEHGPNSVTVMPPEAAVLSRALGLDSLRCTLGPGVRYRYLVGGGRLHAVQTGPHGFLVADYLSVRARLRLLAEPLVRARNGDGEESVAEFARRRFGPEFAERVIDPLVGGLFAGNADELSMPSTFPALIAMEREHGSVTRGLLARWRAGGEMPGRRLFSWCDGVATLPHALARCLGASLKTGVVVRRIKSVQRGFRVEAGAAGSLEARAVIVATQPHVAATLLEEIDEDAAAAAWMAAPSLAVVFLGCRRSQIDHPLDGLGYLAPRAESRGLLGALFCSTIFAGRAPEDHVALAAYVGGARAPHLARQSPEDLIALTREEFRDLLGARGEPVLSRVRQWPQGLPQYRLGHCKRVATLRATEAQRPGLFVTGNYFSGPSVANCVKQAKQTALRTHGFLARPLHKFATPRRSAH